MQAVDRYDECTDALRDIYEDKDGMRKEEVSHITAGFRVLHHCTAQVAALSGPNEFAEFYSRLKVSSLLYCVLLENDTVT